MKVVFFEDVEGTAQVGDVKDVKNGFARNFLLPRGLAGPTTADNLQHARALAEKEMRRQARLDEEARQVSGRFEAYTVSFEARIGETGRLFGSVTNRDIAEKLEAATGVSVEPRMVLLPEPIRELGTFEVTIKFSRNVSVPVTVDVLPDEASREIVVRLEAQREAERLAAAAATAEAPATSTRRRKGPRAAQAESAPEDAPADEAASEDTAASESVEDE